jgi:nucleoside-diphosphate-sugar epimerase
VLVGSHVIAIKLLTVQNLAGCSGVIHVASDLSYNPDPNAVIPTVKNGVVNALNAAARTPSVKRFVLTSSSTAATQLVPNIRRRIDESSYNDEDVKIAWAPPPYDFSRAGAVYSASKVEGERAAWSFVRDEQPSFILNTVLPSVNLGPILHKDQPGSSAAFIKKLYEGDPMGYQMLQMTPPTHMVNVGDTARLHVAALLEEDVKNERLFAWAEPFNYSKIVKLLKEIDPSKTDYPPPSEAEGVDMFDVATARAEELLRRSGQPGFIGMKDSMKEQFDL